ncbi:MAG TPA: hypothetical protein VGO48_11025 [Conexibacter sp.]|jgi:hypothetical protein|nr:hypothetical protein [Conexibacter sp.]
MPYETLRYAVADGVATIALDQPDTPQRAVGRAACAIPASRSSTPRSPAEEPPSIECNEDAGQELTDE